jgi:hypothetical protein
MSDELKVISFSEKYCVISVKTHVFGLVFTLFEVDIVVPVSHLICDMRFWADIEGTPPYMGCRYPYMQYNWIIWVIVGL